MARLFTLDRYRIDHAAADTKSVTMLAVGADFELQGGQVDRFR